MGKLVSSYHCSGQSQKDFAQFHGLTQGKLHYWIKKLSKESNKDSQERLSFIPLEVTGFEPSYNDPHTQWIRHSNSGIIMFSFSSSLHFRCTLIM